MTQIHKLTINQIKELLNGDDIDAALAESVAQDERQGVQQLWKQYQKRLQRARQLQEQWELMTIQEKQLRKSGHRYIAGVDEVGRGPIAGPVVAAAVILPEDFFLAGLNDSKKISPSLRESYYEEITSQALAYSVSFSSPEEIDRLNIYQATMKVMRTSVTELSIEPDICLVDGLEVKEFPTAQLPLVGGDGLSVSIAAASIVAKVTRDRWMTAAAAQYPNYGFDRNAGYGTSEHLAAIAQYGPCPLHRMTFAGVKEWTQAT